MAGLGALLSKVDLRDYNLNKLKTSTQYPDSYEINMKHMIKNQQNISSCTAHALSSILEYHDGNIKELSTNFIYGLKNKLFLHTGKGETIRDALSIAKDYGDPIKELCPGNNDVDEVYEIANKAFEDESILKDAYLHKIDSYVKLKDDNDIKYALMNFGPVIACIK